MISSLNTQQVYPFDARGIGKRFRHAAILGALDALNPGETMRFVNDHDPLPLLHAVAATLWRCAADRIPRP